MEVKIRSKENLLGRILLTTFLVFISYTLIFKGNDYFLNFIIALATCIYFSIYFSAKSGYTIYRISILNKVFTNDINNELEKND